MKRNYLSTGTEKIVFEDLYPRMTHVVCLTRKAGKYAVLCIIPTEICLCGIYADVNAAIGRWSGAGSMMV